jgi:hypothetical protein
VLTFESFEVICCYVGSVDVNVCRGSHLGSGALMTVATSPDLLCRCRYIAKAIHVVGFSKSRGVSLSTSPRVVSSEARH